MSRGTGLSDAPPMFIWDTEEDIAVEVNKTPYVYEMTYKFRVDSPGVEDGTIWLDTQHTWKS